MARVYARKDEDDRKAYHLSIPITLGIDKLLAIAAEADGQTKAGYARKVILDALKGRAAA